MFLIGTNWKMNKTLQDTRNYVQRLGDYVASSSVPDDTQLFIIPPYLALETALTVQRSRSVRVGVQNVFPGNEGPFTGEVSAMQAADAGASIALIGHSERRSLFGETDETVNKKVLSTIANGLTPLICVGERAVERDAQCGKERVIHQVKLALHNVPQEATPKIWIAYEPVWAIGTGGQPASADYAEEIHTAIRMTLIELFGSESGSSIPIIYGGSVDVENSREYVLRSNVDGVFVGRTALDVESFILLIDSLLKIRAEKHAS